MRVNTYKIIARRLHYLFINEDISIVSAWSIPTIFLVGSQSYRMQIYKTNDLTATTLLLEKLRALHPLNHRFRPRELL